MTTENMGLGGKDRPSQATNFWVEHMLGAKKGALVKFTIEDEVGRTVLSQLDPAEARKIATDLMNCAARAEYEADMVRAMTDANWEDGMKAAMLHMVRSGEEANETEGR